MTIGTSDLWLHVVSVTKISKSGWSVLALAYIQYSHQYDADEEVAREARAGLWSGAFIAPWDWRHRNRSTKILGAVSVPIGAQKTLLRREWNKLAPNLPRKAPQTLYTPLRRRQQSNLRRRSAVAGAAGLGPVVVPDIVCRAANVPVGVIDDISLKAHAQIGSAPNVSSWH